MGHEHNSITILREKTKAFTTEKHGQLRPRKDHRVISTQKEQRSARITKSREPFSDEKKTFPESSEQKAGSRKFRPGRVKKQKVWDLKSGVFPVRPASRPIKTKGTREIASRRLTGQDDSVQL